MNIMNGFHLQISISDTLTGDKMLLPQETLKTISSQNHFSSLPLTFRISLSMGNEKYCFASALEYTAQEGSIVLSTFLANCLSLSLDNMVANQPIMATISVAQLPKCNQLKLLALDGNYLDIPDIKALLERHLRTYHLTITRQGVLNVVFGRQDRIAKFRITDFKPDEMNGCTVVDTDIEVDIVPPLGMLGNTVSSLSWSASLMPQLIIRSTELKTFILPKSPKEKENLFYQFEFKTFKGQVNFYIGYSPTKTDHLGYCVDAFDDGEAKIVSVKVDGNDEHLAVCAEGYHSEQEVEYEIILVNLENENIKADQETPNQKVIQSDMKLCSNCMQPVPITALARHEAFCERNNIHCTKCNRVFLKNEYSQHWHCTQEDCLFVGQVTRSRKHLDMIHTLLDCSCGIQLLLPQIATHKKTSCPSRYIICRYCHLLVQAGEKSTKAKDLMLGLNVGEHESTCGGRTIQCVKCSKNVQLKDIQIHAKSHALIIAALPTPVKCPNIHCPNIMTNTNPNPLNLCATCFRPFYSNRHDQENQKLAQRLVGAYHSQLMMGCSGVDWCRNNYCFSNPRGEYSGAGKLDPTGAAVKAMELLQNSKLFASKEQYFLCVNQSNSEKINVAQSIHEMLTKKWKFEWCLKAVLETYNTNDGEGNTETVNVSQRETNIVQNAERWLKDNAPPNF